MKICQFDLPCTNVQVKVNNKRIEFEVYSSSYSKFWIDEKEYSALGSYELMIDVSSLKVGDDILIEFQEGHLQNDGGGEKMSNIVGELKGYTFGMGVPATVEYENDLIYGGEDWPDDMNHTYRVLPYEQAAYTNRGFLFEIVDDPSVYLDRKYRTQIIVQIVWEDSSNKYAWELVSCLTS